MSRARTCAAANGGGPSLLQSAHLVAAVAELGSFGSIEWFHASKLMKRLIRQISVAAVAATIVTGCCTARQDPASWQYKVVKLNTYAEQTEQQINELAGQGWTVVSVSTLFQGENRGAVAIVVLKRHKKP